jgi:colanic acid/amylovoran biosynthesis protein
MRILVEPSDYRLLNRGDVASLSVALHRLGTLWPEATVEVLTDDPDNVRAIAPSVTTRSSRGHEAWDGRSVVSGMVPRRLSVALGSLPAVADAEIRARWPRFSAPRRALSADLEEYLAAVAGADLVVVTGMGGIADEFQCYAIGILGTLRLAAGHGTPTAMMSQQIGPVVSGRLRRVARRVLPGVGVIAVRERRRSVPLLKELGVDLGRVRTTGDDTIALAHALHPATPGAGMGLNLRTARYSRIDATMAAHVGEIVRATSRTLGAPLVGLPVSTNPQEDDAATISQTTGTDSRSYPGITDLEGFISLVQDCRVVVSGSYHGAVFALAQGIPAVCLTNSPYYDQKFLGLRDLFGEGCEVVALGTTSERDLGVAMKRAWANAPELKGPLLAAAAKQVDLGRAAYAELPELVGGAARAPG